MALITNVASAIRRVRFICSVCQRKIAPVIATPWAVALTEYEWNVVASCRDATVAVAQVHLPKSFHFLVEIESSELPVLISRIAIATGESDYDDDKADWQSEKHKPRSRAKGRTFIECVVNEN
jgi:hypothetical protein